MLEIEIPGYKVLRLSHVVLDYNGTIAIDGKLMDGVKERLKTLARSIDVHVLTADTFGSVRKALSDVPCKLSVMPVDSQAQAKLDYVRLLGCDRTVCIGNGRNDMLMLKDAALGIALIQTEGCSVQTMLAADVAALSALDALDLLLHPLRLTATLRS